MPRMRRAPEFLSLQRRQIDSRKELSPPQPHPKSGWIRTVRTALGMSAAQLGRRLGMSQQAVAKLERSERAGTISLGTLSKVADALECDLQVQFIPRTTLERSVREQARKKALSERNRVVHTMRLEAQDRGLQDVLNPENAVDAWMTTRIAKLWD